MRCALIFFLVAGWLAVLGLHAHSRRSHHPAAVVYSAGPAPAEKATPPKKPVPPDRPRSSAKPSTSPTESTQSWIVRGYPRPTQEEAVKSALENARSQLLTELNGLSHTDRGDNILDVDYVRRKVWKDLRKEELQRREPAKNDAQPELLGLAELKVEDEFTDGHWFVDETRKHPDNLIPETHQVSLKIGVSLQDRADLQQQIRQHRMEDRMLGLGKLLGVVVLLLSGIAGYLRLDEWTKGYYTTWLRLGVLGLIGIAGMGYWLLP